MILHRTGLIELDYNEKDDILLVKWPDLASYEEAEIEHSLHLLIDSIKHYDIKNLLIDSRTIIDEIDRSTYHKLLFQLSIELGQTRLKKVARIASADQTRENMVQEVTQQITSVVPLPIEFSNFTEENEAIAWLKE